MMVSSADTIANNEDILTEILLRAPAETLIRLKFVSKHWLSLISSRSFRNSHTSRNKSLYICATEVSNLNFTCRYRVHAIKLSDLFSLLSDTTASSITTIYPSNSKFESESNSVLREVASVGFDDDPDLPIRMGFGVFGCRIVLAGGIFTHRHPNKSRKDPKPCYVLDTTDPKAGFDKSVFPEITQDEMINPLLEEIDGKLYAFSNGRFSVYEPYSQTKSQLWTPLEPPPFHFRPCSCSVLDSMILATHPTDPRYNATFCYDTAASCGSWTPIQPLLTIEGRVEPMSYFDYFRGNNLVVDCEDDEFDSLMFRLDARSGIIQVYGIRLFKEGKPTESEQEGVPTEYELVAEMDLPELPDLPAERLTSYSCDYLGDGKVCFALLYGSVELHRPLLVFTFEFTYKKAGATSPPHDSSTGDSSILRYISYAGSFSAKALGYYLFAYNYDELFPQPATLLSQCFVL